MEIFVNRDVFLPVLNRGVGVVERRQTLPILGYLHVKAEGSLLTVVGTDLEMEVRGSCEADVREEGSCALPARKLFDIVRNLEEGAEVRVRVSGDKGTVTAGRSRFSLGTLPADDFPFMQGEEISRNFSIAEFALKRVLDKTAFAMAQQDVRYYLNGVYLEFSSERLRAVATDGHRLARYEHGWAEAVEETFGIIVPVKAANEVRRLLGSGSGPVSLSVGEKLIRVAINDAVIASKLVDGRYPDFERVIPAGLGKVASLDRDLLRRGLARTAILSNERFRGVRLEFEEGSLRLRAHNPEQEEAVEELELDYQGDAVLIGFNLAYLGDVLGAIDAERVEVRFEDSNSSSVWRGLGDESETYVVMPMRL